MVPPEEIYKEVKESLRKSIFPYNGTAFAYEHAIATGSEGLRLATPLRDLWAMNMSALACKLPLAEQHGRANAEWEGYEHVNARNWGDTGDDMKDSGSLRIMEHRAHAAYVYLDEYAGVREGGLIADDLRGDPSTTRARVYSKLVNKGWAGITRGESKLEAKLSRWGLGASTTWVEKQGDQARKKLAPHIWNFQFRLIYNALPFYRRLRKIKTITLERGYGHEGSCYFCGGGEDSAEHTYQQCQIVKDAYEKSGIGCGGEYGLQAFLIPSLGDWEKVRMRIAYNYAVWRYRTDVLMMLSTRPSGRACTKKLHEFYQLQEGRTRGKQKQEKIYSPPVLPSEGTIYFTDGSASPNPGPSGAGALRIDKYGEHKMFASLGFGTNNVGELYAIGMVLTVETLGENTDTLHIFTDSEYAIGCIDKGWKPKHNQNLIGSIKFLLADVRARRDVEFTWVKGHSKIKHNDTADEMANLGTKASKGATEPNGIVKNAETNKCFYYELKPD